MRRSEGTVERQVILPLAAPLKAVYPSALPAYRAPIPVPVRELLSKLFQGCASRDSLLLCAPQRSLREVLAEVTYRVPASVTAQPHNSDRSLLVAPLIAHYWPTCALVFVWLETSCTPRSFTAWFRVVASQFPACSSPMIATVSLPPG